MLRRCWFCWFSICKEHLTYCFSDGCWFVQSFSQVFPVERLYPTGKIWLVLIICSAIIISYYHLVLGHEKNWDHYLLAASQWLCKYIMEVIHTKFRTFVNIPSNLLKHCLVVHIIMSEHAILDFVDSVSNPFEYDKFMLGIFIIDFSKVLDT